MKRLIQRALVALALLGAIAFTPAVALAAPTPTPAPNPLTGNRSNDSVQLGLPIFRNNNTLSNTASGGVIMAYVRDILRLLSSAIGAVILLMLVIAGIQYITSLGDPKSVAEAKNRITNAIIALVLFLMAFAIISFLVPGGIVG